MTSKKISNDISYDVQEETSEAKARWFQSLLLSERMELLCLFTDFVLNVNPRIMKQKDAQPVVGRVRVLSSHNNCQNNRVL